MALGVDADRESAQIRSQKRPSKKGSSQPAHSLTSSRLPQGEADKSVFCRQRVGKVPRYGRPRRFLRQGIRLISPDMGTSSSVLCYQSIKERDAKPGTRVRAFARSDRGHSRGEGYMTAYCVTLRDRETQTVVGYYNGAWTTDRYRAIALPKREVADDHAARMRDLCPRNAELINVEEIAAAD